MSLSLSNLYHLFFIWQFMNHAFWYSVVSSSRNFSKFILYQITASLLICSRFQLKLLFHLNHYHLHAKMARDCVTCSLVSWFWFCIQLNFTNKIISWSSMCPSWKSRSHALPVPLVLHRLLNAWKRRQRRNGSIYQLKKLVMMARSQEWRHEPDLPATPSHS